MVDAREPTSPFGSFLFPHIFRSFRLAVHPSKLAVAFAAVTVICLTGWLMDLNRTVVVTGAPAGVPGSLIMNIASRGSTTELDVYVASESALSVVLASIPPDAPRLGVFTTLSRFVAAQLGSAVGAAFRLDGPQSAGAFLRCAKAIAWAFERHTIYSVVFFSVALVALSLAGGAICRIAALQFARNERPRLVQATRFAARRLVNFLAAPIAPVAIAILLGLPILLLGLLGNIPWVGELLTGLLLPLAFVGAFFIAVVLVGAAAGLSLMFPAIAYEDSDFFDAVSRSFSNVYGRPWQMGFYTLVAALYGTVCYLFVRFFAFVVLWATRGFLQLGLGDEKLQAIWPPPNSVDLLGTFPSPDGWSLWLAAILIRIGVLAVVGLTISFVVSLYFSASTVIYALMRNRVDGTSLDEIHEEAEEPSETANIAEKSE
ncbi:MAG: hypothetical protein KBE65_13040 [Phycisphaerae bacterium]|nr:hypothetical protein [Phycisphaerae bacterium]